MLLSFFEGETLKITKEWCEQQKISMEFVISEFDHANTTFTDEFEDLVCKKYIELQNVKKVADFINESGRRNEKGTRFDGKQISEIIRDSCNSCSKLAKALHEYNNKLQNGNTTLNSLIKGLMKDED